MAIKQQLEDKTAREGESLRLECELSQETPEVTWTKENEPLHPGKKYECFSEGRKQILIIHNVSANDQGGYSCVTSSGVKTSATVSLESKKFYLWSACFLSKHRLNVDLNRL